MSTFVINRANDLLPRYMGMGNWKAAVLKKLGRASRTGSKRGRLYVAVPPEGGWTGGTPENNGLRGRKA